MFVFYNDKLKFSIIMSEEISYNLLKHRQKNFLSSESGGMLFTNHLSYNEIIISYISEPGARDTRKRRFFKQHEQDAQYIIDKQFKLFANHYIGDWHTHAEPKARPSQTDLNSIKDIYIKSTHKRPFFLLLIIPSVNDITACYLAATDGESIHEFNPVYN